MKKAQQIARLSRRCFAEVEKMAADPGRYCKSKKITSYTFQFLKHSISEEDAYEILRKVVSGESVIAELNKKSRSTASLKKTGKEGEIPEDEEDEDADLTYQPSTSNLQSKDLQENQEITDLRTEIDELHEELRDEKNTTRELRKTLQSALQENLSLRQNITDLVDEKGELRKWFEKKIRDLEGEVASLKKPLLMADLELEDEQPLRSEPKHPKVKASKPSRSIKEAKETNRLTMAVKVKGKNVDLLLEDVCSLEESDDKVKVRGDILEKETSLEEMQQEDSHMVPEEDFAAESKLDDTDLPSPSTSGEDEILEPPKKQAKTEICQDMNIAEWVAVFYPHKFYVGRVTDLPENGNPSLRFLDRRPEDVFVYRRDTEQVERRYIFRRQLRVELKGKNGFCIADYGGIEKDYEEF